MELDQKKVCILDNESGFAYAIGSAVLEKPKVSFWMVLIPILFLYFVYRMQKFKKGRAKFHEDFMKTRRRAVDLAFEAAVAGGKPNVEDIVVLQSGVTDSSKPAYASWIGSLVEYYMDLMRADGDSFESLARSAFHSRTHFLIVLSRLSQAEKDFYAALKPQLVDTDGAWEIIAAIEDHSQKLRRKLAERVFP